MTRETWENRWRRVRGKPPRYHLRLDYPTTSRNEPRYTAAHRNPHIDAALEAGVERYAALLRRFEAYFDALRRIPATAPEDGSEPCFINPFFDGLDGAALYCLLAELRPALYIEVGSGHSTRFARRSIRDNDLATRLVSIDPVPRAEIDRLCDEVVRQPLEDVDPRFFDRLGANDVLFLDNSHRCFMNSDVTVCFLDLLPRLAPGVYVHLHDIFWPLDYPADWRGRYYNEQYILGALLAAGLPGYEIVLPNHFVSMRPDLAALVEPLWASAPELAAAPRDGKSFWLRRL